MDRPGKVPFIIGRIQISNFIKYIRSHEPFGPNNGALNIGHIVANRYNAGVLSAILGFCIFHITAAVSFRFGNDEAYTLAHGAILQWSYFDHPPLHLWIAHYTRLMLGSGSVVRLPFVLMFALTAWSMFGLTRRLFGLRAGLWAAFALNVSGFFTVPAAGWVLPDGPLLLCLAAAVWQAAGVLYPAAGQRVTPWRSWLLVGFWMGLAGLSKYNAALVVAGLVLFLAQSPRHRVWFAHPAPYCGALVSLALLSPVLIWNSQNGWVSVLFQGGRGSPNGGFHVAQFAAMVAGQIGLLLPWVAAPLILAMARAGRRSEADGPERFLLCLATPTILVFTVLPLVASRGLPHWPMPGWLFGFPLLGAWLAAPARVPLRVRNWAIGSVVALLALAVLGVSEAETGWIRLAVPAALRYGDPTLESFDWTKLGDALRMRLAGDDPPAFVVARTWIDGGKIDQATAGSIPVLVFSNDPRQFAFDHDPADFIGQNAVIVTDPAHAEEDTQRLTAYFEQLGSPEVVPFGRSGMVEIKRVLIPARRLVSTYQLPYPTR